MPCGNLISWCWCSKWSFKCDIISDISCCVMVVGWRGGGCHYMNEYLLSFNWVWVWYWSMEVCGVLIMKCYVCLLWVVFCACIFDKLYCFWLWVGRCAWGEKRKKGVGGVMHNIYWECVKWNDVFKLWLNLFYLFVCVCMCV